MSGLHALIFGASAQIAVQDVIIGADTVDFDLRHHMATVEGWDQSSPLNIRVIVNPDVVMGASSTATAALTVSDLPSGSVISIENHGHIVGAGGDGASYRGPQHALPGGHAIHTTVPIIIVNDGIIGGGGGGGGADYANNGYRFGGSGGGGAGSIPGKGGIGYKPYVYGDGWGGCEPGSDGSLLTGGAPGSAPTDNGGGLYAGQKGGDLGVAGANGRNSNGGAAGSYIVGNTLVTWQTQGDCRGTVTA
jgi:hypothetical protein